MGDEKRVGVLREEEGTGGEDKNVEMEGYVELREGMLHGGGGGGGDKRKSWGGKKSGLGS